MQAERHSVKLWRVRRKKCGQGLMCDAVDRVIFQSPADAAEEDAAGLEHAKCLAYASCLVRKEHEPKLADDRIKRAIIERKLRRIGLPPFETLCPGHLRRRIGKHRLVQISSDEAAAMLS